MIFNYIKLAWRVLGRRKSFTFISLFGISFTLGILMVTISFLQSELGTDTPLSNKNEFIYMDQLKLQRVLYDTINTIDTVMKNNQMVFDTTQEYKRTGSWQWNSEMSNDIAETYFNDISGIADKTIFATGVSHDLYVNGVKIKISAVYSDASYWNLFDHQLTEGRVFDQLEMEQQSKVVVISDKTAQSYFDRSTAVVGEEILIEDKNYRVIGVYPDKGKFVPYVSPDLVIPYTNLKLATQDSYYHGFFEMMFLMDKGQDSQNMKKTIADRATTIPLDHPSKPEGYNEVVLLPETYNEMFASGIYYEEDTSKSLSIMKWVLISLLGFFIFLPTINLINLNVSRILDRSSEIGVRKAFGATQSNIIGQFIIENVVQTLLGGILGLILAMVLINLLNSGGYLGNANLSLSPKFFLYSFLITLLFGIISGLLPALRMSKLQIVKALKVNQL